MPIVKAGDIRINYEENGTGEPLLLIMGITAPGTVWEKHSDFWGQTYRCIMPDNRGVGLSDKPVGKYSSELMADDHANLLKALEIESVRVVGVSMGSIIAQQMAIRHPDLVQSTVLMCPWARCDNFAKGLFNLMINAKARFTPAEFMEFIQLLIFSKKTWDSQLGFEGLLSGRDDSSGESLPQPLHGLIGQAHACMDHDVVNDLNSVRCPVLVIGGQEDIFTPAWMAQEVANSIPKSELHLYPESGHAFHWENLDDFNSRVLNWLQAH